MSCVICNALFPEILHEDVVKLLFRDQKLHSCGDSPLKKWRWNISNKYYKAKATVKINEEEKDVKDETAIAIIYFQDERSINVLEKVRKLAQKTCVR